MKRMSLQRIFARGEAFSEKGSDHDYKKEDITVRFFRMLARPVVNLLNPYTFITPNRLTWFGFSWVIIGAWLLVIAESNVFILFLVGFCYWFASYVDTMDGMLARLRKSSSKTGEFLDSVLEEGKGFFFFLALGFHIQDSTGHFTLTLGTEIIGPFHVWFLLFFMYGLERWMALMSVWGNVILEEPRIVSFGNIYFVWVFLIFNILDWFLVLYTIGIILVTVWTLFEKTFNIFPPKTQSND
jgi:phosphatidylglycerophosphate synthase